MSDTNKPKFGLPYPARDVQAIEMMQRGWIQTEDITTEEELFALPDGSVVLCIDNRVRIFYDSVLGPLLKLTTQQGGSVVGHLDHLLPAQLIYRAEETNESDG